MICNERKNSRVEADALFYDYMNAVAVDCEARVVIEYNEKPYEPYLFGAPHRVPLCCSDDYDVTHVYSPAGKGCGGGVSNVYFKGSVNGDYLTRTELHLRLRRHLKSFNLKRAYIVSSVWTKSADNKRSRQAGLFSSNVWDAGDYLEAYDGGNRRGGRDPGHYF